MSKTRFPLESGFFMPYTSGNPHHCCGLRVDGFKNLKNDLKRTRFKTGKNAPQNAPHFGAFMGS
jgi:hypothetical protein